MLPPQNLSAPVPLREAKTDEVSHEHRRWLKNARLIEKETFGLVPIGVGVGIGNKLVKLDTDSDSDSDPEII